MKLWHSLLASPNAKVRPLPIGRLPLPVPEKWSAKILAKSQSLQVLKRSTYKNIPADCFPRVSLHDFIKKHLLWTTEKRANSHGFVTLQFQKFSKLCTIPMGRKKKALKQCYLQGIVTYSYFLGPQNGVRFLRCCSFRCGIGYIFVALFVKFRNIFAVILHKSRHETFSNLHCHWRQYFMITALGCPPLLLLTLFGMCPFSIFHTLSMEPVCTVTLQVWTCVKYVPKQSIP